LSDRARFSRFLLGRLQGAQVCLSGAAELDGVLALGSLLWFGLVRLGVRRLDRVTGWE
jgi:hypothetical protein